MSPVKVLKDHTLELAAALVAFAVYCAFSGSMLLRQSQAPQFVYLADAFVHGRLWVMDPPNLNDWVQWNGRWYVSFPPFPAVVMMPFVALNGLQFNDVFFCVCLSAVNIGLFAGVLKAWRRAGRHERSDGEIALLTAFFAFGTVYFYTSIRGEVWFTAHVVGVTLTLIYLWAALDAKHPLVAGLAIGCLAITRANMAFAFPFFLLECFLPLLPGGAAQKDLGRRLAKTVLFGVAAALPVLPALWMNHERWGSWTEFGHSMLYHNRVNADVARYGLFNPHFFPNNFRSAFLLLPELKTNPLHLTFDGNGMSMFVTTPLLMTIPFIWKRSPTLLALALTAAIVAIPGLFYMNNGWFQFGFRFSNDYLPYLFFMLALGTLRMNAMVILLGLAGIAVSTWGAIVFGR
jgi:hypothetical protein